MRRWLPVLLVSLAACAKHQTISISAVPVPPEDSRWEKAQADRIHLPLTNPDERKELVTALTYGLNRENQTRHRATDPNAERTYGALLDFLGKDHNIGELDQPQARKLLAGPVVKQVVDARDTSTPKPEESPVAVSDGRYWWIFYPGDNGRLKGVMVVKVNALETLIEKGR
jgi:hypothetical protein